MLHQTSGRIHNKNVSTHLIGNIKRGEGWQGKGGAKGQAAGGGPPHSQPFPSSLPLGTPWALIQPCYSCFLQVLLLHVQAPALREVALASSPSAPWMVSPGAAQNSPGVMAGAGGLFSGLLAPRLPSQQGR